MQQEQQPTNKPRDQGKTTQKQRDNAKRYRDSHKEHCYEMTQRWADRNPEKVAKSRRDYYINNRERLNERVRKYRKDNLESHRAYMAQYMRDYRARKKAEYELEQRKRELADIENVEILQSVDSANT